MSTPRACAKALQAARSRIPQQRSVTAAAASPQPFNSIPGPRLWPLVGSIPDLSSRFDKDNGGILPVHSAYYNEFGEVVRHKTGPKEELILFHPKDMLDLYRSDGEFPDGAVRTTWPVLKYADEMRAKSESDVEKSFFGMVTIGEEWQYWRRHLNYGLFAPKAAETYFPLLNECSAELSARFPNHKGDLMKFCNLAVFDLFCSAIIGKSLHVSDENRAENHHLEFCWKAQEVFHIMGDLFWDPKEKMMSPFLKTNRYKAFETLMTDQNELGRQIVQEVWDDMHADCYLKKLSEKEGMTPIIASRVVGDLLGAAVDTTGTTLTWLLYDLARHPEKQERLAMELRDRFNGGDYDPTGGTPPYLKACYRESLRFSPIGAGGTNKTTQRDVVLGGYLVPKGTTVSTNTIAIQHDESIVDSPHEFMPERWLPEEVAKRKGTPKEVLDHKVMATNFGFGPRMCLGARLAKNEIFSVVSRLVQDWEFTVDRPHEKKVFKLLISPSPSPSIHMQPRVW